ncbi:MAG: MotA/TolQ/ExbB proton channel family protein [Deltaproteobacteria bacterium]|nr:MotA/TolQ/ExbB proton channel family protein [Deltaproteobacteria bacterium]
MQFTPQELWNSMGSIARIVLFTLLIMSVASVYVAIERSITFLRARRQSRALADRIAEALVGHDLVGARALTEEARFRVSYLGHLLKVGLGEMVARFDRVGLEAARRAMDRSMLVEALDLKKGTAILATVGSTAPFVGLVGTVFGIINAFAGMAETGSGGLASVSAGIAEALVTTAVGIAVAILGVWLFNYFNSRVEAIQNEMAVSAQEFLDWGEKAVIEREENPALGSEDARTEPVAPLTPPEQA